LVGCVLIWSNNSICGAASGNCDNESGQPSQSKSRAVIILDELQADRAQLVDVRNPAEYAAGHAEEANVVPLGDIQAGKFGKLSKDKKLYLYCNSGRRADSAKSILNEKGYANVENIGGLTDWQSMGGRVVR